MERSYQGEGPPRNWLTLAWRVGLACLMGFALLVGAWFAFLGEPWRATRMADAVAGRYESEGETVTGESCDSLGDDRWRCTLHVEGRDWVCTGRAHPRPFMSFEAAYGIRCR